MFSEPRTLDETMRKILIFLLAAAALLAFASCGGTVSDAEAREILGELIPKAEYFNEAFWGKGLPAEPGPYQTMADLKAAASEVYSREYMEVITETILEGTDEFFPRYDEVDGVLRVDIAYEGYNLRSKLYPEQAKVVRSGMNLLEVDIPSDFDGEPAEDYRVTLVRESGRWLLDSPTY